MSDNKGDKVNKDGLNTLDVNLTLEDIKMGSPWSPYCCPVTRAIRRLFHDKSVVICSGKPSIYIEFPRSNQVFIYKTPPEVVKFIAGFDKSQYHCSVKPIQFTLVLYKELAVEGK